MISEKMTKKYCCEDLSLIENYDKAISDTTQTWVCHHRVEILPCGVYKPKTLIKIGLYWKRPASELIFMTRAEHNRLHFTSENNPNYGKHLSDTTKKKLSKANFGKGAKPILQYAKDGEFVREWASAMEAQRELRIAQSSITKCCQGKLKSAGGFVWRYK